MGRFFPFSISVVMDLDLRGAKLEKEAAERRLKAKLKREKDEILEKQHQAVLARRKELEEAQRIANEAARVANEALANEEFLMTGGIQFEMRGLEAYLLETSEDDKIVLPESAFQSLTRVDAFSSGVVTFRIAAECSFQNFTHCGVKEFSAPNNKVGLPMKVVESLLRAHQPSPTPDLLTQLGKIYIKYIRLTKAKYAKLQPLYILFSSVEAVKECLELNLKYHTTLTPEDFVSVWYRGIAHVMKVVEVRSENEDETRLTKGCSLVDTDVEIDLEVSLEFVQNEAKKIDSQPSTTISVSDGAESKSDAPSHALDRNFMRQKRLEALEGRRGV